MREVSQLQSTVNDPLSHYYTSSQSIVPLLTLGVLC